MSDGGDLPKPIARVRRLAVRGGAFSAGERIVPEETAIALTYNRMTHAVMMATPSDLEDFAIGFSLAEGIIGTPADIGALEIVPGELGVELRMDLAADRSEVFIGRRRHLTGPSGCGLCGLESLTEAMRKLPHVASGLRLSSEQIFAALDALAAGQKLNSEARAIHAAGFWEPRQGIVAVREDVGRHNAVDKVAGAVARKGIAASGGVALMTSRVSIEMVQKVAIMGAPIIVAVSAPTALAIRMAEAAGITLIGIARPDGFEIFTRPERVLHHVADHVA